MKPALFRRILADRLMTLKFLFLMAYELIGTLPYGLLGEAIFLLSLLHHSLNRTWIRNIFRGRYSPFRMVQTTLVLFDSGGDAGIYGRRRCVLPASFHHAAIQRRSLCYSDGAYALRLLGLCNDESALWSPLEYHFGRCPENARRKLGIPPHGSGTSRNCHADRSLWYSGVFLQDLGRYLLLRTQFVFYDFDRSTALFLLDYLCIMGAFVSLGYLIGLFLWKRDAEAKPD